jgi:hypothetical protein
VADVLEVFKDVVLSVSTALNTYDFLVETARLQPGSFKFVGIAGLRTDVDSDGISESDEIGSCELMRAYGCTVGTCVMGVVGWTVHKEGCLFVCGFGGRMLGVVVCHDGRSKS